MAVTGTLTAETRRNALTEALSAEGSVQLTEAAQRFGVHPMTIRRDFEALTDSGIARRVRGGIVAISGDDFDERTHRHAAAKQVIGAKLAGLVADGASIGMDASTTVFALADAFPAVTGASVVTNGLTAFQTLHSRQGLRVYLTGGEREEQNNSLVGSLAVNSLAQFNLDTVFVSALSIDAGVGTSEKTLEQVSVKKAMIDSAATAVLAVDSSKLGTRARVRSVGLSSFDVLVTELDPEDPRLDPYRGVIPRIL